MHHLNYVCAQLSIVVVKLITKVKSYTTPVFHSSCLTKLGAVYVQTGIINTHQISLKLNTDYIGHNMDKSNENNPDDIGGCKKSF